MSKPKYPAEFKIEVAKAYLNGELQTNGMEQSMSRVGHCIDNGPTEGFWVIFFVCLLDRDLFSPARIFVG